MAVQPAVYGGRSEITLGSWRFARTDKGSDRDLDLSCYTGVCFFLNFTLLSICEMWA